MESTGEEVMDFSPIELLPNEILQMILSYLPVRDRVRVERVCKKWKNMSTERVWRDKQVLIIVSNLNSGYIKFFHPLEASKKSSKFNTMKDNTLYISADELGIIQSLVSRAGQHIEKFIFDPGLRDGALALSIIATYCHNIKNIRWDCMYEPNVEVFSKLLKSNKQLHSISSRSPVTVVEMLPLRDWKLLDIGSSIKSEKKQWEEKVIALIENSPSLETFCTYNWTVKISIAISKCEQLKKIEFPIDDEIGKNNLMLNTSLMNRLTCLTVVLGSFYDEDDVVNLLRHCINLKNLNLQFLHCEVPHVVQEAVLAHPKLEFLQLYPYYLTDATLSRLLKFKYLRFRYDLDPVTEDGVLKMIENSECLEKLDIPKMIVTMTFFERLVQDTRKHRKILKIKVNPCIYEKALEICEGSRILITTELDFSESDMENWLSACD